MNAKWTLEGFQCPLVLASLKQRPGFWLASRCHQWLGNNTKPSLSKKRVIALEKSLHRVILCGKMSDTKCGVGAMWGPQPLVERNVSFSQGTLSSQNLCAIFKHQITRQQTATLEVHRKMPHQPNIPGPQMCSILGQVGSSHTSQFHTS